MTSLGMTLLAAIGFAGSSLLVSRGSARIDAASGAALGAGFGLFIGSIIDLLTRRQAPKP